jgi:excisionase family DNA binding protein
MLKIHDEPLTVEAQLAELRSMLIEIKAAILAIQGNPGNDRIAYTVQEAADLLGKGTYTVRQWCLEGRINATKRAERRGGTEVWNISAVEIDRYRNEGLLPIMRARLAG